MATGKMNFDQKLVAFGDVTANNNPKLKYFDWHRVNTGVEVDNPRSEARYLEAEESWTVFDGTRTLTLDGTTEFDLTISELDDARYRITWSAGTNPGFRTNRALALSGLELTLTANSNGTLTVEVGAGTPFAAVQTGDYVFVPGTTTGDAAGPFNTLNEGNWQVLSVSNTRLVLARLTGAIFEGVSEVVTPAANADFIAFSAAGVQTSDKLTISDGFVTATQKTFTILAVTPTWIEITSTSPLPEESGIAPTATGFFIYKSAKRLVHVEANQEASVRVNGATDDTQRISPILAGDTDKVGWYQKFGPTWSLTVVNLSGVGMTATVISAE